MNLKSFFLCRGNRVGTRGFHGFIRLTMASLMVPAMLPSGLLAQELAASRAVKRTSFATYDYAQKKIVSSPASVQQVTLFDNTVSSNSYFPPGQAGFPAPQEVLDWGTTVGGKATSFEIGYATTILGTVDLDVLFYSGTSNTVINGTLVKTITLTDIPGSSSGDPEGIFLEVTLPANDQFDIPAGGLGYSYLVKDDDTGPIFATGGTGITNFFRLPPDTRNYSFQNIYAQFYLKLNGDAGTTEPPPNDECATATTVGPLPFTDQVNTRAATVGANDPVLSCADGGGGKTVWYKFTPTTSTFVKVSTVGSTPEDYDTALGVFTGSCNNLTEILCNDDLILGVIRQSDTTFAVTAGQTYFFLVGEWNGGGPQGGVPTGGDLVFSVSQESLYQGPATGTVASGASVSTDDFGNASTTASSAQALQPFAVRENKEIELIDNTHGGLPKVHRRRANFVLDTATDHSGKDDRLPSATIDVEPNAPNPLSGFPGIEDIGQVIPPDPHVAAGPEHLVATVNRQFAIYNKSGTQLKLINANEWYASVLPGNSPCDPQVVYDHHSGRWIMVWIECGNAASSLLLSVSDDSNPLGDWCNWRLPGDQNGSTPSGLSVDYPKLGVDKDAIYVTNNMFAGTFEHVQLRVIPKAQLLSNTCGALTWIDFWDLRDPDNLQTRPFTVAPAVTFGTPSSEYLISDSPYVIGTFVTLWALSNPLSATPTLTAVNVPVDTSFGAATDAQQLGGGEPFIDTSDRRFRNAVYRNGSLWTAHSVPGGTDNAFALARYLRINTATATATEDAAFGADNFWYFYPAVMVDQNSNLTMVVNRSGLTEFAGIRYTGRLNTDPPGLQPSAQLKAGESNYIKTFGGVRNRWGDYNGIALDASDNNKIWMFAEYAETPVGAAVNDQRWGTWFGQTTFAPLAGSQISLEPEEVYFGEVGLNSSSANVPISIRNIGSQSLTVTAISVPTENFAFTNLPALPAVIPAGGSIGFAVRFAPITVAAGSGTIVVSSNDADTPTAEIKLFGLVGEDIDVPLTTLAANLQSGDFTDLDLTISNLGAADLTYRIGASGAGQLNLPSLSSRAVSRETSKAIDAPAAIPTARDGVRTYGVASSASTAPSPSSFPPADFAAPRANGGSVALPSRAATNAAALFNYDVSTAAGEQLALGVEFDGANFWVTGGGATQVGEANRLFKYDVRGNLLATFAQPTTSDFGWRDLAFDGTFLYASDSQNIVQINRATGAVTGVTIPGPLNPNRGLAYDPATDHFWTVNFASTIFEINRSGAIIRQYPNSLFIYGLAWDAASSGGPYLWAWSQDADGHQASRFSPATGAFSPVSFEGDVAVGGIAGGATFTTAIPTNPPNLGVLIALHQSNPDIIAGYAVPPALIADINPVAGIIGSQSSELVKIRIDADGVAPGSYAANLLVGSSDDDEGNLRIPVSLTVTAPQGSQIRIDPASFTFPSVQLGNSGAPSTFTISSIGAQSLAITGITTSNAAFALGNLPGLPRTLAPGQSANFTVTFSPTAAGQDTGFITIASNDSDEPTRTLLVTGYSFPAGAAERGDLYASSTDGRLFFIDENQPAASAVGATGFPAVSGLAINSIGEVYGTTPTSPSTLMKINAVTGAGTVIGAMNVDFVDGIAFSANDVLYGVSRSQNSALYTINISTAQATLIGSTGVSCIAGLSFAPDGVLFASTGKECSGAPGDQIYRINPTTAAATLVGAVGFNGSIPDIAFDYKGNLFGLTGNDASSPRRLIKINPATGAGTTIGALGATAFGGLSFAPGISTAVKDQEPTSAAPKVFALEQNYPNPFNPSTKIRYALARDSHVVLKIYSVLGQEVRTLVDKKQSANAYETLWDGRNDAGVVMPSGIYFYQIRAEGKVETRRMLFLK